MHGIKGIKALKQMWYRAEVLLQKLPCAQFPGSLVPGQGTDLPNCCIPGQAGKVAGVIVGSSALSIIAFPVLCYSRLPKDDLSGLD